MEFSNYYGIVPVGGSMDKNGFYGAATFTDADGNVLPPASRPTAVSAGRDVAARGGAARPVTRSSTSRRSRRDRTCAPRCRTSSWHLDRHGIDPFTQRFEIEYILEGTTRGTGGLRVVDDTCWTGVAGLWAAGDAVSREAIVGSASGAGAPNAAFTIGSGTWSGARRLPTL